MDKPAVIEEAVELPIAANDELEPGLDTAVVVMSDPIPATEHPPIIFLDIDGPMIPGIQYLVDRESGWKRIFPATTIAVINRLCEITGAKVVVNSTHNQPHNQAPNILAALNIAGLDPNHFHPTTAQTGYPLLDRDLAIMHWLSANPGTTRWVAIDDCRCATEDHMIMVDSLIGVTVYTLNDVLQRWDFPPVTMLI